MLFIVPPDIILPGSCGCNWFPIFVKQDKYPTILVIIVCNHNHAKSAWFMLIKTLSHNLFPKMSSETLTSPYFSGKAIAGIGFDMGLSISKSFPLESGNSEVISFTIFSPTRTENFSHNSYSSPNSRAQNPFGFEAHNVAIS